MDLLAFQSAVVFYGKFITKSTALCFYCSISYKPDQKIAISCQFKLKCATFFYLKLMVCEITQ